MRVARIRDRPLSLSEKRAKTTKTSARVERVRPERVEFRNFRNLRPPRIESRSRKAQKYSYSFRNFLVFNFRRKKLNTNSSENPYANNAAKRKRRVFVTFIFASTAIRIISITTSWRTRFCRCFRGLGFSH